MSLIMAKDITMVRLRILKFWFFSPKSLRYLTLPKDCLDRLNPVGKVIYELSYDRDIR